LCRCSHNDFFQDNDAARKRHSDGCRDRKKHQQKSIRTVAGDEQSAKTRLVSEHPQLSSSHAHAAAAAPSTPKAANPGHTAHAGAKGITGVEATTLETAAAEPELPSPAPTKSLPAVRLRLKLLLSILFQSPLE